MVGKLYLTNAMKRNEKEATLNVLSQMELKWKIKFHLLVREFVVPKAA